MMMSSSVVPIEHLHRPHLALRPQFDPTSLNWSVCFTFPSGNSNWECLWRTERIAVEVVGWVFFVVHEDIFKVQEPSQRLMKMTDTISQWFKLALIFLHCRYWTHQMYEQHICKYAAKENIWNNFKLTLNHQTSRFCLNDVTTRWRCTSRTPSNTYNPINPGPGILFYVHLLSVNSTETFPLDTDVSAAHLPWADLGPGSSDGDWSASPSTHVWSILDVGSRSRRWSWLAAAAAAS